MNDSILKILLEEMGESKIILVNADSDIKKVIENMGGLILKINNDKALNEIKKINNNIIALDII